MKPSHELDERVVVAESVGPRAVEGHHQECPCWPSPRTEEPEVSSQSSHVWANGDDPFPIPFCLVLNGEGNEISQVDDMPGRWENCCLGAARIVGGIARGQSVPALRGREVYMASESM
ncbi:hypothetical protein GOBAR_AA11223 [Gossypium barbadense]|uniref:Uncharacterized protein n=1 Tax=Gossypium barbadense TaxID=3634 RepID=A0A2P5Y1H4_GOSBA|nr:hypothetical protein GOBAR_AA11223 [Gossypium barbadense]